MLQFVPIRKLYSVDNTPFFKRNFTQGLFRPLVMLIAGSVVAAPASAQDYAVTNLSLGGSYGYVTPNGINDSGQVAGYAYTSANSAQHAFLYDGTTMQDLGTLGGTYSIAQAINDSGQVAGYAYTSANSAYHAFLYDGTTMQDLGTLGGNYSQAQAINDSGQVAGWAHTSGNSAQHAFLYDGTTMQDLGTLGGTYSQARAINESGQVAGYAYTSANSAYHAFLYDGTTMQDLGTLGGNYSQAQAINDSGQVAGWAYTSGNSAQHAFLYDGTTMQDLGTLGGTYSQARAINESGQVAGYAGTSGNSAHHAFLYDGTTMQDLGTLGGTYSIAQAINESGQVAGWAYTSGNSAQHAFVYDGTSMQDLNDYIDPITGIVLYNAVAISNNGSIVAQSNVGPVLLSASASAPTIGPIALDGDPVAVNTNIAASAKFMDEDTTDTHTALWTWGDGNIAEYGIVSELDGAGDANGVHAYTDAGIYSINLLVTDSTGLDSQVSRDIVVYDPSAGFVTGGGWLMSPIGAYKEDESLSGRANFGFVSKYKKGAQVPTGNTQFRFQAADLNFHSDSYDWLVIGGARAQYKGTGSINGAGSYKFKLTAVDGDINGGGGDDRFRIKIWYYDDDLEADVTVYDNQIDSGTEGTVNEGTIIGGGSIVIHKKK